jgi:hypothetical protein
VNEVQTMAKAGENVGSAVGTALMTARQGAMAASKNGATASRRLARQTARQTRRTLAEHGIDRAQLKELQDAFAESLWRARHELASKIEPPPVGRRRMPRLRLLMAIAMIGAIAGAIASVIFKRRTQLQETGYDRSPDRADRPEDGATTRQFEPRQAQAARPAQPAIARQSTAGDVNGSPAT